MIRAALAALLLAVAPLGAQAQDAPKPVADSGGSTTAAAHHFSAPEAAAFAKQIEHDLAARGVHVALVFRTGRPRSQLRDGIQYTHGAFWVYGDIKGADGKIYKGYASYNLYEGDGTKVPADQSYLAQDFPVDFVSVDQADDVGIIIPSPEMQRRLAGLIASPTYERLHVDSYSLVSNPFDARHQNCTEFLLDVIAAAAWQTNDYAQIKADLAAHFKPTVIHANLLERIFGPMVSPRLKMDDQPGADIVTVDYGSIRDFMKQYGLLTDAYVLQKQD